jgi:hypothetical protein
MRNFKSIWDAFVDYMNNLYYEGCIDELDCETVDFHYAEFKSSLA